MVSPAQERSTSNSGANAHSQTARETHVTAAEALNVGYTFMRTGNGTRGNGMSKQAIQLVYTGQAFDSLTNVTTDCYYVFALQPKGFVIVAADNRVEPILGYSYDNNFEVANMPAHVRGWLGNYEKQIEAVVKQDIAPTAETTTKWSRLKAGQAMSTRSNNTVVGPLLTTTWDQGQYYNALCPEDANGPDGHVLTGCVATAMAQIINYWGYPVHGRGSHSYNVSGLDPNSMPVGTNVTGYGTLVVHFDSATYDYANMPDALTATSTPQEVQAVAQLMYHCGVAVNMFYGYSESGAYEEDVRAALISYYGFAPTLGYTQKQMYTNTEWTDSLRANIDRGEPVFYCGSGIGVHAFVLDGYKQDDFFHFNFGWSGFGDGWYMISAINPSWSYNDWQSAIMGVRPSNEEHAAICHKIMYVQNNDYFTVTEPIDLYPMRGGSEYKATNEWTGVRINLNLVPEDSLDQLVLDILDFGNEQSVVIYDGINQDSLVRVIETRGFSNYDGLPTDSIFQNMACTDFSPIISTRHGFTILVYTSGGMPEGFHLRVSDASGCRMISNLSAVENASGVLVSWTENGNATQWQVKVGETLYASDSTHLLLTHLTPNTSHTIQVRAVCGDGNYSPWNNVSLHKKDFWKDIVTSEPESYYWDGDTIRITSAEGLAWLARRIDNGTDDVSFYYSVISIEEDLDLSGHLWSPIQAWWSNVEGHGHIVSNMDISTSGYGGLFSTVNNAKISNLGFKNAWVNSIYPAGPLAGYIQNCQVDNCWSVNHIVTSGNSQGGGLIGSANNNSKITNCYAYGDVIAQFGYGGLVGVCNNSDIHNCVTRLGDNFNWRSYIAPAEYRGLLTEEVSGGIITNCFSDISNAKWYNPDPETFRYYFLGNIYNVDVIENLATFNIAIDSMGLLIADTAVNYTLGENMDVVTALNSWVAEYNSPNYRIWIRDSVTHLPVFGNYYEVTCPNVSNITAENIVYNNGFAVALSWQEEGEAENWQIKYNLMGAPEDSATVMSTNTVHDTIERLQLGNDYVFYVRPICGGEDTIGWGQPLTFHVDKTLWVDMVTECPEGYSEDSEGNVTISSPEGLAWLAKMGFNGRNNTITIANDLDMGAYKWTPIGRDSFEGTIEGNNHVISNIYCDEGSSGNIGLIAHAQNANFNNIVIQNSSFTGFVNVGSLVGYLMNGTVKNCHANNVTVKGVQYVGGLGGFFYGSCETRNCSSSGYVYADLLEGGLIGEYNGTITNCYSNCCVRPMGTQIRFIYGGLLGTAVGIVENCYGSGDVEAGTNDAWDAPVGRLVGSLDTGKYLYARNNSGLPFVEGEFISDTASFNNAGVLNNTVTIANSTYTNLLDALNAWVDANNSDGIYRRWAADSANVNGGFPVFAAIPCITVTSSDTIVACDSYTWNGTTYTESGDFTQTFTNANGCDSIVTLHLTIYPTPTVTISGNQNVCETEPVSLTASVEADGFVPENLHFTWYESGQIRDNMAYGYGDDSVYVEYMYPSNDPYHYSVEVTFGADFPCASQSGEYLVYVHSQPAVQIIATETSICVGGNTTIMAVLNDYNDSNVFYSWSNGHIGQSYTFTPASSGAYTFTVTATNLISGCTSIDEFTIDVNDMPETPVVTVDHPMIFDGGQVTLSVTNEIEGAIYTWYRNGFLIEGAVQATLVDYPLSVGGETTTYNYNVVAALYNSGCVSSISANTDVTVAPTPVAVVSVVGNTMLCEGGSTTLHVEVIPATIPYTYQWYVDNEPASGATSADFVFAEAARITPYNIYVMVSANGGYSGIAYAPDITVVPQPVVVATISNDNVCEGETLTLNANTSGTIAGDVLSYQWYQVVNGNTVAISDAESPIYATSDLLIGSSYNFYVVVTSSIPGCSVASDTLETTVQVMAKSHTDFYETACDSFTWIDGVTYTESTNTPSFTLTNAAGCDSVVTLNLTVNYGTHNIETEVACDSYEWNGETYTTTGVYTYEYTNADGCPSVDTLHLTINYSTTGIDEQTACEAFTWIDGVTYTESTNTPTFTLTNAAGCDSIVTLILTINSTYHEYLHVSACEEYVWNGETYLVSGDYDQTFTAANGCDSVVTLHLTVNYGTHNAETEVACDSYEWNGETYTTSGTYTYEYTNADGCPSVDTLHLTINYSTTGIDEQTACESFTWIDGVTYTESTNEPTFTLTNAAGCDSVVTLNLTVNFGTHNVESEVACDSYEWHGETYATSGTYTYEYTNADGCPSVDTLYLTINYSTTGINEQTACESFTWIDGVTYTESTNTPTFTLTNAAGCDSVVTLNLTIYESTTSEFSIITEDSCYTWNDIDCCASGDYTQTFQTIHGCDSVVTLHLTITVGVDDHETVDFKVFPNPTNGVLNVECRMKNEEWGEVEIHVVDMYGKLIQTVETMCTSSLQRTIDISDLASGVYFVKLMAEDKTVAVKKVVKQ